MTTSKIKTTLVLGKLHITPPLLLAPMAGISDLAFRLLARAEGAPFCFTEMISAEGLVRNGKNTLNLLKSSPEDRPLGIQLFGNDSHSLAEAARIVEGQCDLIDINMGCPVKKVVGGGAGSALLRDTKMVSEILRAVRKSIQTPLTIKIRTGWSHGEHSFLEIAKIAEEEGCSAVTLHPRSRAQMFSGNADWEKIAEVKSAVRIPVIGSGDVFSGFDVRDMFARTGCDGVMIARGAMGNPWIFREALQISTGKTPAPPDASERRMTALRHLALFEDLYGDTTAVREMRKHISWYVKGLPGAARFRSTANTIQDINELRRFISDYFTRIEDEQTEH